MRPLGRREEGCLSTRSSSASSGGAAPMRGNKVAQTSGSWFSGGFLSAPDHAYNASGCPELRPASANQPLGPRWPAICPTWRRARRAHTRVVGRASAQQAVVVAVEEARAALCPPPVAHHRCGAAAADRATCRGRVGAHLRLHQPQRLRLQRVATAPGLRCGVAEPRAALE